MYLEQNEREKGYEPIITIIKNGILQGIKGNDKSHISYVLIRSFMMAWIELGGGYQYGSDVRSILTDVTEEFGARISASLKNRRKKVGDITDPIVMPERKPIEPTIQKVPPIVDTGGKPLSSDTKGEK